MRTKASIPARDRILTFLTRVGRPVTGCEILNYAPRLYLRARELRALMAELEAEGLVTSERQYAPTGLDRETWTYRLTAKG